MVYSKKTIEAEFSKNIIAGLQNVFGDSYEQIAEKTGLSKKLISSVSRGEKGLTFGHLRKIEESYEIPHSIIFLKAIEVKGVPEGLRQQYEALRKAMLASAELDEHFAKEEGRKYKNWRDLI